MFRCNPTASIPTFALSALAMVLLATAAGALDDDTTPPNPPPATGAPGQHHHNPARQACKKQADAQGIAPGDARREFMKSCIKSAKDAPPPPS